MSTNYSAVPVDRRVANALIHEEPEDEEYDEDEKRDDQEEDENEEEEDGYWNEHHPSYSTRLKQVSLKGAADLEDDEGHLSSDSTTSVHNDCRFPRMFEARAIC